MKVWTLEFLNQFYTYNDILPSSISFEFSEIVVEPLAPSNKLIWVKIKINYVGYAFLSSEHKC